MRKLIVLIIIFQFLVFSIYCQTKQELIKEYINLTKQNYNMDTVMNKMQENISQFSKNIPGSGFQDIFSGMDMGNKFKWISELQEKIMKEVYENEAIAIYDKAYSKEDLEEFLKFYKSPAGQKLLKTDPVIDMEIIEIVNKKFSPILTDSITKMYSELLNIEDEEPDSIKSKENNDSKDMSKYLDETRNLVRKKDYSTALERFKWFFDHALEYQPSMSGVRNSFALSDWKKLADKYPPALEALKSRRDSLTTMAKIQGSSDAFNDVKCINSVLKEDKKSVELFEYIISQNRFESERFYNYIEEELFNFERYDLIREFIGDPMEYFFNIVDWHKQITEMSKQENLNSFHEKQFARKSIGLINYCLYINDLNLAMTIQDEALKIVDNKGIRDAIKK